MIIIILVIISLIIFFGSILFKFISTKNQLNKLLTFKELDALKKDYIKYKNDWNDLILDTDFCIPYKLFEHFDKYEPIINCFIEWHKKIDPYYDKKYYEYIRESLVTVEIPFIFKQMIVVNTLRKIDVDIITTLLSFKDFKKDIIKKRIIMIYYLNKLDILPNELIYNIVKKII